MGKRKTRKRSRSRKKRGGAFNLSSICIWYGEKNGEISNAVKKKGWTDFTEPCIDKSIENFEKYEDSKNLKAISIDSNKNVVGSIKAPQKLPSIMSEKSLEVYDGTQTGNYNIYVVRYEAQCKYGGERYQLYQIANCKIENQLIEGTVEVTNPKWMNSMIFTNNNNNTVNIIWGKTTKKNVHVNSFLLEELESRVRRGSHGGKRRRSTKKKRRRKRKGTKKKRRRKR